MTHQEKPGTDPAEPRNQPRTSSRWLAVLPVITLVVGLGLGALVTGVATDGDDDRDPEGTPTPSASASGGSTAVVVPDACRLAAESVAEATALIREAVSEIRDFRAEEILGLLNQLEDLDVQARQQAARCNDVEVTQLPTPTGSPSAP